MNAIPYNTGISFDVIKDKKFLLKLSQQGLHSHRIGDEISQEASLNFPFKRPLSVQHGPFKDTVRCSSISNFYAYTNRTKVVVGEYSYETGFSQQQQSLPHMSNVNAIDWAYDAPHLLTGSQDDFAVLWDVQTCSDIMRFRGGSVDSKINFVAMSRRNCNLFSTCHDRDIKIWDKRSNQRNSHSSYAGHSSRITYFDWSPDNDHTFLTCSLDKTVKMWSLKNRRIHMKEKKFSLQVWRAMFDRLQARPNVFIAITVPDDRQSEVSPQVCEFDDSGPRINILSSADSLIVESRLFSTTSQTTLVGLSKTGKLHKWVLPADPQPNSSSQQYSNLVSPMIEESNNQFPEMPNLSSSPNSSFVSTPDQMRIPKYNFLTILDNQRFIFYVKSFKSSMKVKINLSVPEAPQFVFEEFPTLSRDKEDTLAKELSDKVKELRASFDQEKWLDKFVRYVNGEFMEQYSDDDGSLHNSRKLKGATFNKNVPFPRSSGARFCGNNILVTFYRPSGSEASHTETKPLKTPKAFMDIAPVITPFPRKKFPSTPSVSGFYYPRQNVSRQTRHQTENHRGTTNLAGIVEVKVISEILPISCEKLATEYCLDSDKRLEELCEINIQAATNKKRQDLVQLWQVLKLTTELKFVKHLSSKLPWAEYPYGRKLIETYINFYYLKKDVQTLAMIFGICDVVESKLKKLLECEQADDRIFKFLQNGNMLFPSTSLSISIADCCEDTDSITPLSSHTEDGALSALDRVDSGINGKFIKISYANILYNWGLLNKRAEILKSVPHSKSKKSDKRLLFEISSGNNIWTCSICRLPVRSLGSFCLKCLHGGHSDHMQSWFTSILVGKGVVVCPTGCGCNCVDYMGSWDD